MAAQLIHVKLRDEGVEVWAPVEAGDLGDGTFRLPKTAPHDQRWSLRPDSLVRCERRVDSLVAVGPAN